MIAIRIPKKQRGKAWRAMIEIGSITHVGKDPIHKDPIYVVSAAHLEMLHNRGFTFEVINPTRREGEKRRRAASS